MKKQNNILGFTIGEVLVTMLIITLMTLASIPIAKNAKMKKELPIDKNYWAAMYENGQLVVKEGKKGEAPKTTTYPSGTEIPFTPPKGVSKLNVTVIGGGGGGAAGVSRTGAAEIFFPDTSVKKSVFSPVEDGQYQIIAVGGGGGGGGGHHMCNNKRGTVGWTGGAVIATAKLKRDTRYEVFAGPAGARGKGFTFADSLGNIGGHFLYIIGTFVYSFWETDAKEFLKDVTPQKYDAGGGHGMPSYFIGPATDIQIQAGGGAGGKRVHFKLSLFHRNCSHAKEGDERFLKSDINKINGKDIITSTQYPSQEDGELCQNGFCDGCPELTKALDGFINRDWTFGNGGAGGKNGHGGKAGHEGFVLIKEIPTFGGGGGQAGSVSFFSFEVPIEASIPVYVGRGGKGGIPNATINNQKGQDGEFSRFGDRIIAAGGYGGEVRQVNGVASGGVFKAEGLDGTKTSIGDNIVKQANLGNLLDVLQGGYKYNSSSINGQGHGENGVNAIPGSGGGGGGALTESSNATAGKGGDGATGMVLVSW